MADIDFVLLPGSDAIFDMERPRLENDDGQHTFSQEAMHAFLRDLNDFVMSRMIRAWDRTERAPQKVVVHISVTVDGQREADSKTHHIHN